MGAPLSGALSGLLSGALSGLLSGALSGLFSGALSGPHLHSVGAIVVGEGPAILVDTLGRSAVLGIRGSAHLVNPERIRTREARELMEQRRAVGELHDEPEVQHEPGRVTNEQRQHDAPAGHVPEERVVQAIRPHQTSSVAIRPHQPGHVPEERVVQAIRPHQTSSVAIRPHQISPAWART